MCAFNPAAINGLKHAYCTAAGKFLSGPVFRLGPGSPSSQCGVSHAALTAGGSGGGAFDVVCLGVTVGGGGGEGCRWERPIS